VSGLPEVTPKRLYGTPFAIALVVLTLVGLWSAQQPPATIGVDAPLDQFSATRALGVQTRIFSPEQPHPLGSAANARFRSRIVAELGALGLEPEVRSRPVCAPYGVCGTPYNIMARVRGEHSDQLVVLATHYDSVFAGPGAGDAAASVGAILEIARALKAGPPLKHDVLLLIDDGEEAGLLGARAFLQEPEAKQVRAYINMEARGSRGLSRLFETTDGNATFAKLFASHLPHPSTSSLFFEIYKLLPNDTDLSVFRTGDGVGIGMAFAEGAAHYHTPLDDLAHLDPRTVQDQGESALALARAFVGHEGALKSSDDAVYFDVLGRFVVFWPQGISWVFFALSFIGTFVWYRRLGTDRPKWGHADLVAFGQTAALLAVTGMAWVLQWLFGLADWLPTRWQANLDLMGLWFACFGVVVLLLIQCLPWVRRQTEVMRLYGVLLLMLLGAVVLWRWLPGAVYLLLVPWMLGVLVLTVRPNATAVAAGVLTAALLITFGPLLMWLYDLLGSGVLFVLAPLAAWVLMPILSLDLPQIRRPRVLGVLLLVLIGLLTADVSRAPFDDHTPMPLAIGVVQTSDVTKLVYQSEVKPGHAGFQRVIGRANTRESVFPWSKALVSAATPDPATVAPVVPPVIDVIDVRSETEGTEVWRVTIRSQRGAELVGFALPASIPRSAIRVNGASVTAGAKVNRDIGQDWLSWTVYGDEADIEVTVPKDATPEGFAFDRKAGLPEGALPYATRRDEEHAVTAHGGDSHWAITAMRFVREAGAP